MGNHRRQISFLIAGALLLALSACDSVYLQRSGPNDFLQTAGGAEFLSALKVPQIQKTETRVLFFVDQSYSMIHGKCPTDLDGPRPKAASSGCSGSDAAKGIDPEAHRYTVLKKWINEIKNDKSTEVAVFPFSGGMSSRPRQYPYNKTPIKDSIDNYKFLDADKALKRVDELIAEQAVDLKRGSEIDEGDFVGSTPLYMGTTVPLPTLEFARDQIMREMEKLQKEGKLFATQFRVIYLSDGVFKPTEDLLDKALGLAGSNCSIKCVMDPRKVSCDSGYLSGYTQLTEQERKNWPRECGVPIYSNSTVVESCFCLNIGNDFYEAFGDPSLNRLDKIVNVLEEVKTLPKYYGEGSVRLDFVKIHPERILEEDKQNIFEEIQRRAGDSVISSIIDDSPPFSLTNAKSDQETYQLIDFYAVNLNSSIDENGKLASDSDGDGLSDFDEQKMGTDPTNPRTPDQNGKSWCLDSIEKKYGCKKTNCNPLFDADHDGLNECEELTLETDIFRKENGKDHILDYFKAIRGLIFSADLRQQDSNGDGISDYTNFKNGIHPLSNQAKVPEESKIKARVQFKNYVYADNDPAKPKVGQYTISIDQVPLVATMATTVGSVLHQSKIVTRESRIQDSYLVGTAPHRRNENELLFVAKVKSIQDPMKNYYMFARKKILASGKNIKLQVDFADFVQLPRD